MGSLKRGLNTLKRVVLLSAGFALEYYLDPSTGPERRAHLWRRVAPTARERLRVTGR
jgi:hypothetical protein